MAKPTVTAETPTPQADAQPADASATNGTAPAKVDGRVTRPIGERALEAYKNTVKRRTNYEESKSAFAALVNRLDAEQLEMLKLEIAEWEQGDTSAETQDVIPV